MSGRRALAAGVVLVLGVSACTGSGGHRAATSVAPRPVPPVAAPSGADRPDVSLLARAAAAPKGSPEHAASVLAKAAAGTGTKAQAALRQALAQSGIDLVDTDGKVVQAAASPRLGISVPVGQVLLMSGQDDARHAVDASDITGAIGIVMGVHDDELALRQGLLDGLRLQAVPGRPRVHNNYPSTLQFLSNFIIDLGKRADPKVDVTALGLRNVGFTGLQAWLLWLGLAAGMAQGAALVATHHDAPVAYPFVAVDPPCSDAALRGSAAPATKVTLALSPRGASFTPWSGLVGTIAAHSATGSRPFERADYEAWTQVALAVAELLAVGQTLTGDIAMSGSSTLVRTTSTRTPGERRTLTLTARTRLGSGQYAACVRTLVNAARPAFTIPNDGPLGAGAPIAWTVDDDPAGALNAPVVLVAAATGGGRAVTSTVAADGRAAVGVQGQQQRYAVPKGAAAYTREVRVTASVQVPDALAAAVLRAPLAHFLSGRDTATTAASGIAHLLRFFSVEHTLRVTDRIKDFLFAGTFDRPAPRLHRYQPVSGTKCGGIAGTWVIDPQLTVRLDAKGQGEVTGSVGGTTTVRLELGPPAQITLRNTLAAQSFEVIPGNFCAD